MPDTTSTAVPAHVTPVQITVARNFLRACVEQISADPARHARIDALDAAEVYDRTLRVWPQGWDDFCEYFAGDIRNELELAAWVADQSADH
ncbi:hypothetical protein ACIO52_04565 [Nocardia sp. NPDC087230]|uniref:hypothetical protein n=1 Tax=Nocardia sp. NPDC087230 TaxID=3364331 RepID=UPI003802210A